MISEYERQRWKLEFERVVLEREHKIILEQVAEHNRKIAEFNAAHASQQQPPEPQKCAECDCDNPPTDCNWIKTA